MLGCTHSQIGPPAPPSLLQVRILCPLRAEGRPAHLRVGRGHAAGGHGDNGIPCAACPIDTSHVALVRGLSPSNPPAVPAAYFLLPTFPHTPLHTFCSQLAHERLEGDNSFYHPYVSTLPSEYSNSVNSSHNSVDSAPCPVITSQSADFSVQ